ncbi:hypothetical protein B7P43_G08686 [Cryptotermes secundus]|uniref:Ionotropic glutamate receptor C-terminal domain-containing protein n=1 Tax=Cryptotermes secundus TaxID=105785 RepID=A0A2J7PCD3_9NEOP|nr:hypothetical protein B7P43_G08686 [Cryptotermes secundus]
MFPYGVLLCLAFLYSLFPKVALIMSHNLYLVRCIRTISDQYLAPKQSMVVAWPSNIFLYPNLSTSKLTFARGIDLKDLSFTAHQIETLSSVEDLFQELSRWELIVNANTHKPSQRSVNVHGSYIILTANDTVLRGQLHNLAVSSSWNPRARFVVALLNCYSRPPRMAQRVIAELWKHRIVNAIALVCSKEGKEVPVLNVYTWFPYQSPERCTRVQDVALLDTWVQTGNGYFVTNNHLFPQKINRNLHGCPIRIITEPTAFAVEDPEYLFINRSRLPVVVYRGGWEIRLLNIISQTMNMTEDYLLPIADFWNLTDYKGDVAGFTRELLNDRADVAVGLVVVRDSLPLDSTKPYHWGQLSWYVPCGSRYPRWMSVSRIFSCGVWVSVMMSVVVSVPIMTLVARIAGDSLYRSASNTLSNTWAAIVSVSLSAMPRTWPLRCFFMSWVCYSLAVDTVFQTYLTSFLIDPGVMPHARNVEELARSEMKLGFSSMDSVFYEDKTDTQSRKIMAKKVACGPGDTCFIWAKRYKNLSILISDIIYKFQSSLNRSLDTNSNLLCEIEDGVVERGSIVMVLPKGSSLLDSVNDIILHVVEGGIFGEWVKMTDHMQMVKTKAFFPRGLSDEYYELSLAHLQSAFYLLLCGYGLAFIIFVIEAVSKYCGTFAQSKICGARETAVATKRFSNNARF